MKLGIVGLPNVGKSTLFNAITNAGAESANYPFCTIEPNQAEPQTLIATENEDAIWEQIEAHRKARRHRGSYSSRRCCGWG